MFGTIRKHSSWLWLIIIAAMVVTMVIYFSPTASTGGGARAAGDFGSIDGDKISQAEFVNASREASLAYFLSYGRWPESNPASGFDPDRETYQRLFFLKKIKDYNIQVDSESVAQAARNILTQAGRGQAVPLDAFVDQVLKGHATAEDFERYVRHQLALQQLISVVTLSSELVTPQEAQALYATFHQEIASDAVFFSGTNYQTSVTPPTPQVLGEFYTNQASLYRIPDRIQVSYVTFSASNYLAQADKLLAAETNLNAIVEENYQQRGTNFYPNLTPDEAKQKIREEMRHQVALNEARHAADEFANQLFDQEPMRSENLTALASTNHLAVKVTAPFDEENGPVEFDGGANFTRDAFRLTPDEPFAGPVLTEDAVYVAALAKKIPSTVPPLESIHAKVAADYKQSQASQMARRAGNDFAQKVATELAAGKSFAVICAEAKVKPVALPPISQSTTNVPPQLQGHVSFYQFQRVAFDVTPGKASEFSPTAEGGFVVYVEKRLPVDQAKMTADLPDFIKAIRQSRSRDALNAWLEKEGSKSMRDTPLMKPKPSPANQSPS
ncbi:MAG TPA: SurA N-terminal domain-containing protein [Verrucomicrobiae bacterium]|nr:SurA N-terminal domain-containing protein [Verrucomicrobiae bacterium]